MTKSIWKRNHVSRMLLRLSFLIILSSISIQPCHSATTTTFLSGTVTKNGSPVCAMVLANGKYMFTCSGDGSFVLNDVSFDSNGEITLYAFCSGLKPYKTTLTSGITGFNIDLESDPEGQRPLVTVKYMDESLSKPGWVDISGTIENENGAPLCAMVLANGQYMFTCNPVGEFNLTIPLDNNDMLVLYGFCNGLMPYKETIDFNKGILISSSINATKNISVDKLSIITPISESTSTPSVDGSFEVYKKGGFNTVVATDQSDNPILFSVAASDKYPVNSATTAATIVLSCIDRFGITETAYEEPFNKLINQNSVIALASYIDQNIVVGDSEFYTNPSQEFETLLVTAVSDAIDTLGLDNYIPQNFYSKTLSFNNIITLNNEEWAFMPQGENSDWAGVNLEIKNDSNLLNISLIAKNYWLRDVNVYQVPNSTLTHENIRAGIDNGAIGYLNAAPFPISWDGITSIFDGDKLLNSTNTLEGLDLLNNNPIYLAFIGSGNKNKKILNWKNDFDVLYQLYLKTVLTKVIVPTISIASGLKTESVAKTTLELIDDIDEALEKYSDTEEIVTIFESGDTLSAMKILGKKLSYIFFEIEPNNPQTNLALKIVRKINGKSLSGVRSTGEKALLNLGKVISTLKKMEGAWNIVGFGVSYTKAPEVAIYSVYNSTILDNSENDITGNWNIFNTPDGGSEEGPKYWSFIQTKNSIVFILGNDEGRDGHGTVSGSNVSLQFIYGEDSQVYLSGTISGNQMSGTYYDKNSSGTWRAVR